MREWFNNLCGKVKDKVSHVDKDEVLKWSLMIGGGLMGLAANIFDTRKKDREFREYMAAECREKANLLMNGESKES
jgi:hypothetical protein